MWLGDLARGAQNLDDGAKVESKREWHKIEGHIRHWNNPREGTKYSIVLYWGTRKEKSRALAQSKRATHEKSLHM